MSGEGERGSKDAVKKVRRGGRRKKRVSIISKWSSSDNGTAGKTLGEKSK